MQKVKLRCSCGAVQGKTENVDSSSGTRLVCFCDDCQAFARFLKHESRVLDQYGGTEIFQMPVSHLDISQGKEHLRCMRLTSKGLYRWYAGCCNTPIGNTLGAGAPFIGVIHDFMDIESNHDAVLGKIRGYVQTKFSLSEIPPELNKASFQVTLRSLRKLLVWKLQGLNKPSVFFNSDGTPVSEPEILS